MLTSIHLVYNSLARPIPVCRRNLFQGHIESPKLRTYAIRCQVLAAKVWLFPGTEQLPSMARNKEESTALFCFNLFKGGDVVTGKAK